MPTMSPALIGFLRGAGVVAIVGLLSFAGDVTHLTFLNPQTALIVSGLAVWLEGVIQKSTGSALFGAAKNA